MAMMNYGTHSAPFAQKFVSHSRFMPQSRYEPYGAQQYSSPKMFKFEYFLELLSQM